MKKVTIKAMHELIAELRAVPPKRPLTYGESLQVTRVQAARLRRWADATEPDINLIWLIKQRAVPVNFVASHKLGEESGLTTDQVGGKLQMFINGQEPRVRQRFSVLHEFKHVLDFDHAEVLHAKLGNGSAKAQKDMIEWLANEFAGHVLMPTGMVKRLWFSTQNVSLMASMFNVSVEAMTTRLEILGLIGTPKQAPRVYFRTHGILICARQDKPHPSTLFEQASPVGELVAA
jgi:IrrE N-terminal-like domain